MNRRTKVFSRKVWADQCTKGCSSGASKFGQHGVLLYSLLLLTATPGYTEDWIYTARPGDNLWNLCQEHLTWAGYWPEIQKRNQIKNPRRLLPGTRIRFPIAWLKQQPVPARVVAVRGTAEQFPAAGGGPQVLVAGTELHIGTYSDSAAQR